MNGPPLSRLVLVLPEPPGLNEMLDLAKERIRGRPIVYHKRKKEYELLCTATTRGERIFPPRTPWALWEVESVEIRRRNALDPIEALACLKWPVDWLVNAGFVAGDSPRHLPMPPMPRQRIDRANRGITLAIRRRDAP